MEQGKGADCLLAPLTKAASARGILVLAAAVALALAGCGGDSDSGTESAESASAERAAATAPQSSPSDSSAGSKSDRDGGAAQGQNATTAPDSGGGGKQATAIAPPKGPRETGITPEQREKAKLASISLTSPVVLPVANGPAELPAAYTCDGKDTWPALEWQGVPAGSEELVLFAMNLAPVGGKLFFGGALAGIDPDLTSLEPGRLPKGTVVGQNSYGENSYSICPPQGQAETYFFALYALPERLGARANFDPYALRKEVQELSRNVGILPVAYARG